MKLRNQGVSLRMGIMIMGLSLATALFFQNCGRLNEASSLVAAYNDSFFAYDEPSKPDFYAYYQVIRQDKDSVTKLRRWRFFGSVSLAEGSADVKYVLTIKDGNGKTVCPNIQGTLTGGAGSIIEGTCDSPSDPTYLVTTLTLTSGTLKKVINRNQSY